MNVWIFLVTNATSAAFDPPPAELEYTSRQRIEHNNELSRR